MTEQQKPKPTSGNDINHREKHKAEAYVRKEIPELMELSFGCVFHWKGVTPNSEFGGNYKVNDCDGTTIMATKEVRRRDIEDTHKFHMRDFEREEMQIIGHPIQLQHWADVLERHSNGGDVSLYVFGERIECEVLIGTDGYQGRRRLDFNLTTGQPATEADYKAFNEIVGV